MGNIIILGSFVTDLVMRAPRFPHPGESLVGDEFGTFLGGKGFNQTIAARRLGASITLFGRIGNDSFGDDFLAALAREGIDSTYITRDPAVGTGVSCVIVATNLGQNMIVTMLRANLTTTSEQVEAAMQQILAHGTTSNGPDNPDIFLTQCETSSIGMLTGLKLARAAGMTTILNAAPIPREPLGDDLFSLVDILIVNETEAGALTGIAIDSPTVAKVAAEQLLTLGPKHIIITLGAQGSTWSTRESTETQPTHQEIPAIPIKQVDATAAGDTFCGAFVASLAQGMTMLEALRRANAAGALAATRMGALPSLPTLVQVEALLRAL